MNRENRREKRDRSERQQERRRGKGGADHRQGPAKSERQTQPRRNLGQELLVDRVESLDIETTQPFCSQCALHDPTPLLCDAELETIGENFVRAAALAQQVGFDFVDVKCCHGYLLHELLGATARNGVYGGSFDNRTRLFRKIVDGIPAECPGLHIGVRVSINYVFPFIKDVSTGIG
ncbi:MAG: hypothetical protein IIB37_08695, partial [Gemmatimonadetes bacterium]|nr:hypothetical protein [Gemmatimonadota bacterium]